MNLEWQIGKYIKNCRLKVEVKVYPKKSNNALVDKREVSDSILNQSTTVFSSCRAVKFVQSSCIQQLKMKLHNHFKSRNVKKTSTGNKSINKEMNISYLIIVNRDCSDNHRVGFHWEKQLSFYTIYKKITSLSVYIHPSINPL